MDEASTEYPGGRRGDRAPCSAGTASTRVLRMPRVLTLPKATRTLRQGEEGEVRRSPQAVACRKRGVEELGRPQTFLPWKTTVYGLQLLRHGRGNPDTEQCWNLRTAGGRVTGRWRSTVTGKGHRMRLGSRIERSTLRWGKPTTWGRSRRKHVARKGNSSRTCRTGSR